MILAGRSMCFAVSLQSYAHGLYLISMTIPCQGFFLYILVVDADNHPLSLVFTTRSSYANAHDES